MDGGGYTEISEKRTSKLGYLLLVALFVFIIIIGQTIFSDISKIPERPIGPTYCSGQYSGGPYSEELNHLKNFHQKPTCRFNDMDREFGLDVLVANLEPEIGIIVSYNKQISSKNSQIYQNERQMSELLSAYGISLQETIAGEEEVLMDKPEIKGQYTELRNENEKLRSELLELEAGRDAEIAKIEPKIKELKDAYSKAQDTYSTRLSYYNLKVFLLKLLFILPFFGASLRYYLKYKKIDSPYTIIVTSIFYASTILFLQIVLTFLYNILPRKWFGQIFSFLMSVSILRYVVYYGVTIIVILILGGVVYYIQKKIYDPKRVAMRHLKDSKCPSCSISLSLSEDFCPNCGRRIKTKCPHCGKMRYTDLPHCPACGK
jgi:predicted RNA-binding Zn-ribbon protein involved in translation (DUF1610 family)